MNLPNKLTISRIVLACVFMVLLFCRGILAKYLALLTFVIASLTDWIDGHIARKEKLENDFGRLMDPIADKILILIAFVSFNNIFRNTHIQIFALKMEIVPAWMLIIIIFRELVITGLRLNAARHGEVLSASSVGKHKTASQMIAIISILILLIIRESAVWSSVWELWFRRVVFSLVFFSVILTVVSGLMYLIRNRAVFFTIHEKAN